jgi:CDP-diacylglycerol--glycerol-3-phosphate 3-phosphatidyltransferase
VLDSKARPKLEWLFGGAARVLSGAGLAPVHATLAALTAGLSAGAALYFGHAWTAVCLLWISGFLDAVDGSMARLGNRASPSGALLDIVCDRVVELSIFWALALRRPDCLTAMLALVSAALLSMTVFLTTGMLARNRGPTSFHYQAGLMERTEGFLASTLLMVLPEHLVTLVWVYAALIGVTIVQRLLEALRLLGEPQ